MSIEGIIQPDILEINEKIRLKSYRGEYKFALHWYQDKRNIQLIDGPDASIYDEERIEKMYSYLNSIGELYIIELKEADEFKPIGDVTFCKDTLPIVIGDISYRQKGIGKLVISRLINRARELDFDELNIKEIYNYNLGSKKLFTSLGFQKKTSSENGSSYTLKL